MCDLPSDQELGSAQQSISREDLPSDQESSVVISSVQQRSATPATNKGVTRVQNNTHNPRK
jgi:hypothetical protein